jgi:heteromeric Ino2p/Ino4p transcription factor
MDAMTNSAASSASPSLSPTSANLKAAAGEKRRLTEKEKKANHLASEKKRREHIRDQFDRLSNIVPGLEGRARSEGLVLQSTIEYIRKLMLARRELIQSLEANGVEVPVDYKSSLEMLPRWFFDDDWEAQMEKSTSGSKGGGSSPGGSLQEGSEPPGPSIRP